MYERKSHRGKAGLAVVLVGALFAWYSARNGGHRAPTVPNDQPESPARAPDNGAAPARASFDFYLLAMSVRAAFCADGHDRMRECQLTDARPLVLHGLWPERNQPGAYPHDCAAPPLHLDAALERQLDDFMPGAESRLREHEWREHGGCSGLDADEYFRDALELARGVDAALAAELTTLAGRETSAAELREHADGFQAGVGDTLVFQCRQVRNAARSARGRPYLVEVRQCVDNDGFDGAPRTLLHCADVGRRDEGCGSSFYIAGDER